MGNSSNNSHFAIHHTDPDNNLTYLVDPASNQFVLREVSISCPQEARMLYQLFEKRKCLTHPHLANLIQIAIDSNQLGAQMLSECPFRTLEDQRTDRTFHNQPFEQQELWSIMASMMLVEAFLQRHGIPNGSIRTSNIYLTNTGIVKILDPLSKGYATNYQYMLEDPFAQAYLSPNQFGCLIQKRQTPIHNTYKSDVFSLGVIMLELGLLESQQHIYQREQIDYLELEESLHRFKLRYCEELKTIIEMMLEINQVKRLDWVGMERFVKKEQISESKISKNSQKHQKYSNSIMQEKAISKKNLVNGLFYEQDPMKQSFQSAHSKSSKISQKSLSHKSTHLQNRDQLYNQVSRQRNFAFEKQKNNLFQTAKFDYVNESHMKGKQVRLSPLSELINSNVVVATKSNHSSNHFHKNSEQQSMKSSILSTHGAEYVELNINGKVQNQSLSFTKKINNQNLQNRSPVFNQFYQNYNVCQSPSGPCMVLQSHIQPKNIIHHQPIMRTVQEQHKFQKKINLGNVLVSNDNTPIAELKRLDKSIQMSGVHLPFFDFPLKNQQSKLNPDNKNQNQLSSNTDSNRRIYLDSKTKCQTHSILESINVEKQKAPSETPFNQSVIVERKLNYQIQSRQTQKKIEQRVSNPNPNPNQSVDNLVRKKHVRTKIVLKYPAQQISNLEFCQPIGIGYTGQMKEGLRHGRGTYYHSKNGIYSGEWFQNKMHGFGKLYNCERKLIYSGEWQMNKINGKGILFNHSGKVSQQLSFWDRLKIDEYMVWYDGQFYRDERKGRGIVRFCSGDTFQGFFQGDKVEGEGVFRGKDTVVRGIWINNKLDKVISIQ